MSHFTKENARHYAAIALQKRHENKLKRQTLLEQVQQLIRKVDALTPVNPEQLHGYPKERLARVREQLDRIDALMATETDAQKLDRLAAAQSRLAEQERIYAGRARPGTMTPERPKGLVVDNGELPTPE